MTWIVSSWRRLNQSGCPVADATRLTLIRRLTYDLTGLPPAPAEIETFLNDRSSAAYTHLVDRLLASPRFGERWGRHWLDVARYGESSGPSRNIPYPHAWRYRDYVIDAVNATFLTIASCRSRSREISCRPQSPPSATAS